MIEAKIPVWTVTQLNDAIKDLLENTFLPVCIQREYHRLWTRRRLEQVVEAAQARNIAIEINDTAHVPHEEFILMAKRAGLKFTFGSDARNHTVGRLDYCQRVARRCRLTERDFFLPRRRG